MLVVFDISQNSLIIPIVSFQANTTVLFAMFYADRRTYGPTYVRKFLAVAFANASNKLHNYCHYNMLECA